MYERVLVPTDGSRGSAHVALQAIDLAEQYGATVDAVHVISEDMRVLFKEVMPSGQLEEQGQRAIDQVERMAGAHGVDAAGHLLRGDPVEEILDYADEVDADLIVAGTHGRSGVKRRLIGSVAERLVRHASCPVMTVRLPESDVTVTDDEEAEKLVQAALNREGYDAEVTGTRQQPHLWVVEADGDEDLLVYLDPVTQRTSIVPRSGEPTP